VKRDEVISSLKKFKKKPRNNSSSKKTPVKRTPKKCDFIATTESIKNLKANPGNTSPKIELFSPKKTQEIAQINK
jgi:hypothetical protein